MEAYTEQARGLVEGGADLLLIETVFDTLNAKAAGFAVFQVFDELGVELPLIVSGTITDRSGRTLSGQTPEAFFFSIRHLRPFAVGLNCALGAELMRPYLAEIAAVADTLVIAYPNAGLPNAMGEYDEGPHEMACQLGTLGQGRTAQHRRRLLRLHARAHRRDRRARVEVPPAQAAEDRAPHAPRRPRALRARVMHLYAGQAQQMGRTPTAACATGPLSPWGEG